MQCENELDITFLYLSTIKCYWAQTYLFLYNIHFQLKWCEALSYWFLSLTNTCLREIHRFMTFT